MKKVKYKKLYHRVFSVLISLVMIVISIPAVSLNSSAVAGNIEGIYYLNNVKFPDKYVQINNNNTMLNEGEIIELHKFHGYWEQRWEIVYVGNEYYKIESTWSDKVLTAPTGYNNDIVTQTTYTGANTQLWKFILQSDGTYKISPKSNSNYFMATSDESSSVDQDLEIRLVQSDSRDKWYLHKCSEYAFKTLTTIVYYDPSVPLSAAQIRQAYIDATATFLSAFNIKFNVVYAMPSSSFTCSSSCYATSATNYCPTSCGSDATCYTNHHRCAVRLVETLSSDVLYVSRVVNYAMCRYNSPSHYGIVGLGTIEGEDTIVSYPMSQNLNYIIQHELSHNLGARDHSATSEYCVMNGTINAWCSSCISAIKATYY